MAKPRPAKKNRVHFVSRRIARRQYLLRPGARVNQAVLYCLAEAAAHPGHGVKLLWCFTMSNHLHYGVYDTDGTYPVFVERFHKMLAMVLNRRWNRKGILFESEQASVVELCDAGAMFDKMIYSLTNAVKDHLVARAEDWPGFSSLEAQLSGEEVVVKRPAWFFAKDTKMAATVKLRFHRPPPFAKLSQRAWARMIREAVRRKEREALRVRRAKGMRVLGRGAVMAQEPEDSPKTEEQPVTIRPTVAASDGKVREEALQRRAEWRAAYAAALAAYRAGEADVLFPAGTYKLWREKHVSRKQEET